VVFVGRVGDLVPPYCAHDVRRFFGQFARVGQRVDRKRFDGFGELRVLSAFPELEAEFRVVLKYVHERRQLNVAFSGPIHERFQKGRTCAFAANHIDVRPHVGGVGQDEADRFLPVVVAVVTVGHRDGVVPQFRNAVDLEKRFRRPRRHPLRDGLDELFAPVGFHFGVVLELRYVNVKVVDVLLAYFLLAHFEDIEPGLVPFFKGRFVFDLFP